jgi:hypothetical protein
MSLHQLIAVFDKANSFFGFFILLGFVLSIYNLRNTNAQLKLVAIINLSYLLLTFLISTKIGSWVNYYTPNVIVTIILIFGTLQSSALKENLNFELLLNSYLILSSLIYFSLQCYNYTLPFIKTNKQNYLKTYNDYKRLSIKFKLDKNVYIFVPTPLLRNFYALNNCMVNTEYYHQASYTYNKFKKDKKHNLKYILFKENESFIVNDIINFFSIDINNYILEKENDYLIYSRKRK